MKTKDPCPRTKTHDNPVTDTPLQIQNGMCPTCHGARKVKGKKCKECNGTGLLLDKIY
jgi:hypothetical protein